MLSLPSLARPTMNINPIRMSFVEHLYHEEETRQSKVAMYRDYYDGKHATQLTDRQRTYLELKAEQEFSLNYCPVVVDSLSERLRVTGFDLNGIESKDAAAEESAMYWRWWQQNRMDAQQGIVHTAAARDSVTYMLVSWSNELQRPVFTHEMACVGSEGVKVHYDPAQRGVVAFASKRWLIERGGDAGNVRRLNLYYPDRIEKYISDGEEDKGIWKRYIDVDAYGNAQIWPTPWTADGKPGGEIVGGVWQPRPDAQPLGVPVYVFKNRDQGLNDGQSELEDVIPVQNALNKTLIDMLATADTGAFRILYLLGDADSSVKVGPGALFRTAQPPTGENSVSFGAIPGEDLRPFIELIDAVAVHIARVSRTPLTAFQMAGGGGNRVSGETLKQVETGLVAKARKCQTDWGNSWEDVLAMARKLHNAFGQNENGYKPLTEDVILSTRWQDAEPRNEEAFLNELKVKREALQVPLEILWAEAGYTPQQIKDMKETEEYQAVIAGMNITIGDGLELGLADAA